MSRILITGASGFLGTKLFDLYSANPENCVLGTHTSHPFPGSAYLDVTDHNLVDKLMQSFKPTTVIHTVALSDPDTCERKKDAAEQTNHIGTKNIVSACRKIGARLDYISTVYVFDGIQGGYTEDDKPNPINWYGETKRRAEDEVATLPQFGIFRFDKLYGYNGIGKPNDDISKILNGQPFEVNSDQIRQPLFVDDVATALQLIQGNSANGVFHLAGPDKLTKYELTKKLAKLFGKEEFVIPIPEKAQLARRPKDATLCSTKIEEMGMVFTPLATALTKIGKAYKADRK